MVKCAYCNEQIELLPKKCKFCKKVHCSDHLLPENHECQALEEYKKRRENLWKEDLIKSVREIKGFNEDFEEESFEYETSNVYEGSEINNLKKRRARHSKKDESIDNWVIWIIIGVIILAGLVYFSNTFDINPSSSSRGKNILEEENLKKFPEANIWQKSNFTYYINVEDLYDELAQQKEDNFRKAVLRLNKAVPSITFTEVYSEDIADIVFGVKLPQEYWNIVYDGKKGTASIGLMIPNDQGGLRTKAYVYDTANNNCKNSNVALHELLHAFGVGHSEIGIGKLMSPKEGTSCVSESQRPIEPENIKWLKENYY